MKLIFCPTSSAPQPLGNPCGQVPTKPYFQFMDQKFNLTFKISTSKTPNRSNGVSVWALPICIIAYIFIFYLFNLSPLMLLNTNKFWFLISITLILIIAADSGAFSSSKPNNPRPLYHLVCQDQKEKIHTLTIPPKSQPGSDHCIAIYGCKEKVYDYVKPCELSDSERNIRAIGDGDNLIGVSGASMKTCNEIR